MHAAEIERIIAFIGAIVVAVSALTSLRAEWKKTNLDDHVTKIMLILLTVGCVIVVIVALGFAGRVEGS
ncbi:MAG TPA: hypothetical protein VKR99_09645 [Candidatus Eremiobacteraceae bacterium]|nr:hypothetical protein [Candidatus Eremiobacteraceae bacterium]